MGIVSIGFASPWKIRTPTPTRYLEQRFVDSFFNDDDEELD